MMRPIQIGIFPLNHLEHKLGIYTTDTHTPTNIVRIPGSLSVVYAVNRIALQLYEINANTSKPFPLDRLCVNWPNKIKCDENNCQQSTSPHSSCMHVYLSTVCGLFTLGLVNRLPSFPKTNPLNGILMSTSDNETRHTTHSCSALQIGNKQHTNKCLNMS